MRKLQLDYLHGDNSQRHSAYGKVNFFRSVFRQRLLDSPDWIPRASFLERPSRRVPIDLENVQSEDLSPAQFVKTNIAGQPGNCQLKRAQNIAETLSENVVVFDVSRS